MQVQPSIPDNAPRYPSTRAGHVESYFWRANHPTERKAIWLKATVLRTDAGPAVAEAWCAVFAPGGVRAAKTTVPLDQASYAGDVEIAVGGCRFAVTADGGFTSGRVDDLSWNLEFTTVPGLGGPLSLYPSRKMVTGAFPKTKLLTPSPALRFHGTVGDERADGWLGMQGHNWGREHAYEHEWGACVFTGADGAPLAMAEGVSGRVKFGGLILPRMAMLTVRRGSKEYRFDRVYDVWNQHAERDVDGLRWTLKMSGDDGEAVMTMEADPREVAALGYANPDGTIATCLNSKLARTVLRVNPVNEEGFECVSAHGGALEFLSRKADPRFPNPV
jgi:hypothetical protein